MSNHQSWDLAFEFPELKDKIHTLKTSNRHFEKLFGEYTDVAKQIHRIEERIDLTSGVNEEILRKKRLALKDELYKMLTA
jgi:uncharacterized protein YdcH (DUF465 family)